MIFVGALLCVCVMCAPAQRKAERRPRPVPAVKAVVVDERVSAVRSGPGLSEKLLFRMRRGRSLSVLEWKTSDGVVFFRFKVSAKRMGWIQWDAVVLASREGEDARLLRLVTASDGFERIDRARIFLEVFPRSPLRPSALLILGDSAQEAAVKLSRDVVRRMPRAEIRAVASSDAQVRSFYLGNAMLDRYARIGVRFTFDLSTMTYAYDGSAWREIVRRHPGSSEAGVARERLGRE
jgi:hypothetical protein